MTASHPARRALELLYLGEAPAEVRQHVSACGACSEFIRTLEQESDALLRRRPAETFVRELRREDARRTRRVDVRQRLWGGLAVAATMGALWVAKAGSSPNDGPPTQSASPLPEQSRPPSAAAELTKQSHRPGVKPDSAKRRSAPLQPLLLAKGGFSLSVIRQRGQEQRSLQGQVVVVPGDKLRLRFVVAQSGPVVAGIVTDEGEWLPLLSGDFEAGLHTPLATLEVDDEPGAGLVLVGSPAAVEAARSGQPAVDVGRVRLVWRDGPESTPAGASRSR